MKTGDIIHVLRSSALESARLGELAGKAGVVTCINQTGGDIKGCWVRFDNAFEGETEWYIPYSSII